MRRSSFGGTVEEFRDHEFGILHFGVDDPKNLAIGIVNWPIGPVDRGAFRVRLHPVGDADDVGNPGSSGSGAPASAPRRDA